MAYVTGTANSFADLLAVLQNACTANGWTLTGNVLSKGTCFAELTVVTGTYPALRLRCGSGQSAGVLSGATSQPSANMGIAMVNGNASIIPERNVPFSFPMTYFAHVLTAPDEVYFLVNYGTKFYQVLAFGQSDHPGLTGSGNWYSGSSDTRTTQAASVYISVTGNTVFGFNSFGLWMDRVQVGNGTGGVDHQLDSATWAVEGAFRDWGALAWRQPNAWNSEAILQPIRVYASRPSGFQSVVLEHRHARFTNIAALSDQQIITLGPDKWKVYPWWSRGNIFTYNNGSGGTYTGPFGLVVRYDGP